MKSNLPTGVTLICSMVPFSFSPTMLRGREKSYKQDQEHRHQARYHEELVVQVGVVEVSWRYIIMSHTHGGSLQARFLSQLGGIVSDDLGEIAGTQSCLHTIHGVGRNHHLAHSLLYEVSLELWFYLHDEVGIACLHAFQCLGIGGGDIAKMEILRGGKLFVSVGWTMRNGRCR